jgi:hypothetical protein
MHMCYCWKSELLADYMNISVNEHFEHQNIQNSVEELSCACYGYGYGPSKPHSWWV